jgi:transposase
MNEWRPRRLTPAQLEERRLAAARLLRAGRCSQAGIARRLGVSEAAVSQWRQRLTTEGRAGLRRRAHTGRPARLATADWQRLGALLRAGPMAAGSDTEQWTLRRVAHLTRREFGVRYHFRSLGRALHARGFSPQHPVPRAAERDEALVRAWLRRDWPALKKGLAASGTRLPSWTRRVTRFGPA